MRAGGVGAVLGLIEAALASPLVRAAAVTLAIAWVVHAARGNLKWSVVARQTVIVTSAYFVYFFVRGLTEGSESLATANAWALVEFEQAIGLFHEERMQSWIVGHQWAINLANWVYIWAHWPIILVIALWLLFRHQPQFFVYRNAFLISGGIGLVIFASFPVAPPRFLSLDLIDTVTTHSNSYRLLQPPALTNQYAAMPSLHFGWNLLMGIAIVVNARPLFFRVAGALLPMAMLFATILTANHFIIDAIAGGAVALLGLFVAMHLGAIRRKLDEYIGAGARIASWPH